MKIRHNCDRESSIPNNSSTTPCVFHTLLLSFFLVRLRAATTDGPLHWAKYRRKSAEEYPPYFASRVHSHSSFPFHAHRKIVNSYTAFGTTQQATPLSTCNDGISILIEYRFNFPSAGDTPYCDETPVYHSHQRHSFVAISHIRRRWRIFRHFPFSSIFVRSGHLNISSTCSSRRQTSFKLQITSRSPSIDLIFIQWTVVSSPPVRLPKRVNNYF